MFHQIVTTEIAQIMDLLKAKYPHVSFPPVKVKFSNGMKKTAGKCSYHNGIYTVTFSIPIMQLNDINEFVKRTVWHEMAHYATHVVYRRMDHGETFKYMMRNVFQKTASESSRCHSFQTVQVAKRKKHVGYCSVCGKEMMVSFKVRSNILNGVRQYFHTPCGKTARFVLKEQLTEA